MCGPKAPEDNSAEVARIDAEAEAAARADEARKRKDEEDRFDNSLKGAFDTAIAEASNYFTQMGLDPNNYMGDISSAATAARGTVPFLDKAPGTYFMGLGENVYGDLESGERSTALRDIDSFAGTGFAKQLIGDTADDPFIATILGDERAKAQQYIDNLLARGVVTDSGYGAALEDLERQTFGAENTLNTIGMSALEGGRTNLRDIGADARSAASNLKLGGGFDPFSYQRDINSATEMFLSGLGDQLRGLTPQDLFLTDELGNIAGARQGAGNTAFDPEAILGFGTDDDEDEDNPKKKEKDLFEAF